MKLVSKDNNDNELYFDGELENNHSSSDNGNEPVDPNDTGPQSDASSSNNETGDGFNPNDIDEHSQNSSDLSDDDSNLNENNQEDLDNESLDGQQDDMINNNSSESGVDPYNASDDDFDSESGADSDDLGTNPELYNDDNVPENELDESSSDEINGDEDGLSDENESEDGLNSSNDTADSNNESLQDDGSSESGNNIDGQSSDDANGDINDANSNNGLDDDSSSDASNDNTDNKDDVSSGGPSDDGNKSDAFMQKLGDKSETIDNLNKAKSLKDMSKMKKEEAIERGKDIAVDAVKNKIKLSIYTTIAPYVIPIIACVLALLILFITLVGAITGSQEIARQNNIANKCTEQDKKGEDSGDGGDIATSGNTEKNAKEIYKYLMEHVKGLKPKQAAGILGAFQQESQMDPKALNGSSGAYGIAQWLGPRLTALENYAEKKGKKKSDLDAQLGYLLKEMNGSYEHSQLEAKGFFKADSVDEAAKAWSEGFERMGADEANMGTRVNYAKHWYSKFGDMDVDTSKAKDLKGSDDNISDASDAAGDNSKNEKCSSGDDAKIDGKIGDSVPPNGKTGKVIGKWEGYGKVPKKYKKYITAPSYDESKADESFNMFRIGATRGQCTELTFVYMTQLWTGKQATMGNGNAIYRDYKNHGAKVTNKPTVGYGFSADPPYGGTNDPVHGHTGVVIGVLPGGEWLMANYNANGEAPKRVLTITLIDGQPKDGGVKFFSGVGKPKKSK